MSKKLPDDPFFRELYEDWIEAGMSEHDADAMLELVTDNQDWLDDKEDA